MTEKKTNLELIFGKIKPLENEAKNEYMNDEQMEHFTNILNVWLQQLSEKNDQSLSNMQSEIASLADQNDRASQEEELSLELRTRDRDRRLRSKIEKSLFELEKGSLSNYGYCESCGNPIGIKRLEARPTANLCIDCKELDEMREKLMA